ARAVPACHDPHHPDATHTVRSPACPSQKGPRGLPGCVQWPAPPAPHFRVAGGRLPAVVAIPRLQVEEAVACQPQEEAGAQKGSRAASGDAQPTGKKPVLSGHRTGPCEPREDDLWGLVLAATMPTSLSPAPE